MYSTKTGENTSIVVLKIKLIFKTFLCIVLLNLSPPLTREELKKKFLRMRKLAKLLRIALGQNVPKKT